LSTNHAERGTHINSSNGPVVYGLPLMSENNVITGLPESRLPEFENLPIMDLLGNVVSSEEIIQRGRSLHSKVSECPPNDSNEIKYDPEDLLCVNEEVRQNAIEEMRQNAIEEMRQNAIEEMRQNAIKSESTQNSNV
ncbi:15007_t:CDS:1, partial [Racocetra fulgida]